MFRRKIIYTLLAGLLVTAQTPMSANVAQASATSKQGRLTQFIKSKTCKIVAGTGTVLAIAAITYCYRVPLLKGLGTNIVSIGNSVRASGERNSSYNLTTIGDLLQKVGGHVHDKGLLIELSNHDIRIGQDMQNVTTQLQASITTAGGLENYANTCIKPEIVGDERNKEIKSLMQALQETFGVQ